MLSSDHEDQIVTEIPKDRPRIVLAVQDAALLRKVRALLAPRYALEPASGWVRGERAGVSMVVGDVAGLTDLGDRAFGVPVVALAAEHAADRCGYDGRVYLPLRGTELVDRIELQLELARLRALSNGRERALSQEVSEARRRLGFVAGASRALSGILDVDGALDATVGVAVPGLAQWCTIDLLENGKPVRKAVRHHVAHKSGILERVAGRYSSIEDRRHPVQRTFTTGRTEFVPEVPVDFSRRLAQTQEHLDLLLELDISGYVCVPLRVQGRTAGVLTLGADSTWPVFTPADVALAEDLAARAEAALERARLFQTVQSELTERRRIAQELRTRQEHERLIFETVDAMVWYKDTDNRVLHVNRAAAAWTGLPAEQIEGRRIDQIFDRERAKAFHDHDLAVIAAGKPMRDLEMVMQDGRERWVQRDTIPYRDGTGKIVGVIILAVDVTEQKLVEDMLRANERAQREFVANVSHEFRTPVAAIKGFAETLRLGAWRDREDREHFLEIIDQNASRLNDLIEDLLTLSALEGGPAGACSGGVDVRGAALGAAERLTETARLAELSMGVTAPSNLEVRCDRAHLTQILENLLDNAIRFNRPLGTVRVRAERRGDAVWIAVEDSGIGIAREHLPRVFERFYRVEKGSTPGRTGLGLHIVKKLAEAHGGRVWAESELGEGSAFYVELPAFDGRAGAGSGSGRPSHSRSTFLPISGLTPTTLKNSSELEA